MSLLVAGATACILLGSVILFLGIAILRDGGRERLHRVTALMLFFGGLGALLTGLGLAARASAPTGAALFSEVGLQFAPAWEFFFPALLLFTLLFPNEHPAIKRFPWIQELIFVPYLFHLLLTVLAAQSHGDFFLPDIAKKIHWAAPFLTALRIGLDLVYRAHKVLFSFVNLLYAAVTLGILTQRGRGVKNPRLKAQLRVMWWGLGTCLLLYVLAVPVPTILGTDWERATPALLVLSLAAGSGSIAYSIIRHRFLDTRLFLRRSLLFGGTASVLAAVYLALTHELQSLLGTFSGLDVRFIEPLFLLIALVILQPLANRVEEMADRLLMRDRREGRVVLEALSRDIVTLMDLPELAARLTRSVSESLACDGAGLAVFDPKSEGFTWAARAGFSGSLEEDWEAVSAQIPALEGLDGPHPTRELFVRSTEREVGALAAAAEKIPLEVMVPLSHGGTLVGALVLGPKATRTRYTREDLDLLALLGNQTAVAIRNTHLLAESLERAALEEELHLARQIQASYLPSVFPRLPSVELSATNVPSKQVGGDYYDCVDSGDTLLIAVADVVGKGVPAALLMSMLQASLRTMATERRSLCEMVRQLNQLILQSGIEGKFATFFLARLDPVTLRLDYSNAGHNPPLLLRADGRPEWLTHGGLLLGIFEDPRPSESSLRLEAGDRLVLYTDGITEAANREQEFFGEERLAKALAATPPDTDAQELVEAVLRSVHEFCDGEEPGDDMTVVAVRMPQPADVALEIEVPAGTP
jgi:serine phosphatase RsbU (regulator of sigma subunit)